MKSWKVRRAIFYQSGLWAFAT